MLGFLVFYYCFSVLFMIGNIDFDYINGLWDGISAVIAILILAPIAMPVTLGYAVCKIYKKY
jgi:hypothetical protein